jgi:single-stranded-DNA-specific exonuclease
LLNVAGRLADAGTAVRLLLQHSPLAATQEAESLVYQNGLRRELDRSTAAEAIAMVPEPVPTALVLYQDHWHSGVLGIAAARLAEKFHRPVILLTKHNGLLTGSARSIPGVNLFEALQGAGHLLESFGGHAFAAGLKMQSVHLDAFKEHFLQAVIQLLSTPSPIPILEIAGEINLSQINNNFINTWRRMAPFGPQHRNPVFVCKHLTLQEPAAVLKNDTLSFRLKSDNERVWQITGFKGIHWLETVQQGPFDLAFTLYESFWQNKHRIGLVIKDIQPSSY